MSLGRWPTTCVHCGSTDFHEVGRIEAGELPGIDEDSAAYACRECGKEFETRDLPEPAPVTT